MQEMHCTISVHDTRGIEHTTTHLAVLIHRLLLADGKCYVRGENSDGLLVKVEIIRS